MPARAENLSGTSLDNRLLALAASYGLDWLARDKTL